MTYREGDLFAAQYLLVRRLGAGSFGEVWLAHHQLADIDVAVKIYGSLDKEGVKDFRDEFKIAYKLRHPNLLHINHFDVFNGNPFLVMPYCAKGSCARIAGKASPELVWRFLHEVAAGLQFLHQQYPPIIHQDIKPDNILIADDDKFVISDFGVSCKMERTFRKSKRVNESSGTLAYMGPEHFTAHPSLATASDIWALGMSAYELWMGDVLWNGMGGCVQLNGAQLPDPDGRVPYDLMHLIHRCLAADPAGRPTAQEVFQLTSSPLHLSAQPPVTRPCSESYHPIHNSKELNSSSVGQPLWRRRWFYALCAGVLLMLVALAWGIGAANGRPSERDSFYACRTLEDYKAFLQEFPKGKFATSAARKIRLLEQESQPIPSSVSVDSLQNNEDTLSVKEKEDARKIFIQPIRETNRTKLQPKRRVVTASELDDAMFERCETVTDYNNYMNRYPHGRHYNEARQRIQQMEAGI